MKVVYYPPQTQAWRESLSDWQRETLAALHRQGKHLRERTNHGDDWRWKQAGCKTYERFMRIPRRVSRRRGHERILIRRTDYGYEILALRRSRSFTVDPDTGVVAEQPDAWQIDDQWFVERDKSANFPPDRDRERTAA